MERRLLGLLAALGLGLVILTPSVGAFDACPTAGPVVTTLETRSVYSDKKGSVIDEERARRQAEIREPLNQFLDALVVAADSYVRTKDPAAKDCGLSLLRHWAEENSLLGGAFSNQGNAVRAWALGTMALAYIKLDALDESDPVIDDWLGRIAEAAIDYERERKARFGGYTNIDYWIGLAVGATGLAIDHPDYWDYAKRLYAVGLEEIQSDGSLRAELNRGQRALLYHSFAATPLVTIARLSAVYDEDLFAEQDGKICRLVDLVLEGIKDPQHLAAAAGAEQKKIGKPYWLPLAAGCPEAIEEAGNKMRSSGKLGGNIGLLIDVLDSTQAEDVTLH